MKNLLANARLIYRAHRYRWKLDPAEIAFLLGHARPGTIAIDIGAHKGGYTYWLAKAVGPRGRVIAFEPQPKLAGKLRQSLRASQVTVENMGISDRCGQQILHVPGDQPSPGASFEEPAAAGTEIAVSISTLDAYLAVRHAPVSFIKCDVEGHELSVFHGAEQTLRQDRPVLLFECEQRHHRGRDIGEIFAYLANLGYRGHFFFDGTLRPLAEFIPNEHQGHRDRKSYCNNFAFVPAGAH